MPEDEQGRQDAASDSKERVFPERTWTVRCSGQLQYRRFTTRDASGQNRICFSIKIPHGRTEIHPEVREIFEDHKINENGRKNGLRYRNDRIHGPTWSLPDHEYGRAVAERIDHILLELGAKLDETRRR